jgi:SRSO17 transposase
VHLVNEHASCAADWRLFCPESWDDDAAPDEVAAAAIRRRRERARIPDAVRHTEKWRLSLEMIDEMTGPGGWGIPRARDGSLPECRLLAEWPPKADEPAGYWLSNLPPGIPIAELVRLAKIRWRIEHDYRELKTGLGLDHFEGRSFVGWHRHVTLAVLAQAFCTKLRTDPKAPAPG